MHALEEKPITQSSELYFLEEKQAISKKEKEVLDQLHEFGFKDDAKNIEIIKRVGPKFKLVLEEHHRISQIKS